MPKTVYNDPTTTVWQGVDTGSVIKPQWGSDSVDKVIHLHNSLNSNVSRENWKPGDRVYIIMDNPNGRLIVNRQDNFVRVVDTGEILAQEGLQEDGSYVRGRVYDADGNDIEEPIQDGEHGGVYSTIRNRGFEQIINNVVAIRVTDSAFQLARNYQDWWFIRIDPED